ncbi:MAG: DinB family protein [Acidobacteriota bacterium]|nr:DinB family protein [Acidobacteriota bacterium]
MTLTELLLASIDEAYDKRSWHGTNLRGSLRGVTVEQAAWRPASAGPRRVGRVGQVGSVGKDPSAAHNIWELTVHAAYWKYDIRRRLTGEKAHSFAIEGSNFWTRPLEGTPGEWRRDLRLLEDEHAKLRAAVAAFPASRWTRQAPGKPFNFEGLVRGVAAHDLYHAGQIQLLKRLQE